MTAPTSTPAVSHLIEVAFKGNRKDFFLWDETDPPPLKAAVIVEADRGEDLGYVHAVSELAAKRNAGTPHGYGEAGTSKKARRLATPDEIERASSLRAEDEDARRRAMERVRANDLVMKLTDAEWQWDRKKLTLYFTADKRVDFRNLVRDLASLFRTRIELKQIGVRDEAKRLDGIGRCGRQYCSASWLPELRPVNLGVAKDQRLSLNPAQISGACGRLMCCLRYEHEFYVESRRKYPKEGKVLLTSRTEEKVVANDIFRERVTLRGVDGDVRVIPLVQLREEMTAAGDPLAPALEAAAHDAPAAVREATTETDLDLVDIELRMTGEHPIAHHVLPPPIRPTTQRKPDKGPPPPPASPSPAPVAADGGGAEGERRPPRRRGRRGGRRNRPSGGDGTSNTRGPAGNGGGSPPEKP